MPASGARTPPPTTRSGYGVRVTSNDTQADPDLLASTWNLAPLLDGDEHAGFDSLLSLAAANAAEFKSLHEGRVAELDASGVIAAMTALAEIRELTHRANIYAELRLAADTADEASGALVQEVNERTTGLETELQFFELEWIAADDAWAQRVLSDAGDELEFAAYHLKTVRKKRPYLLSGPEERILAEGRMSGQQAWARLFQEEEAALEVELDGERVSFSVAYNQWSDADRGRRIAAVDAAIAAMAPEGRMRAYIYNTLMHEKAVEDRLRGYPHWLSSRNLENQTSDGSVAALIEAVQARYDIPHRWHAIKARLLKLEKLSSYDFAAPVYADETVIPYADARDLVLGAYQEFSPEAGRITRRFFDEPWIDAPVRLNKSGGAFCETGGPHVHSYILLNYGGRRSDVMTLAHELGHGLHDMLAAPRGIFHQNPTMTVAETASTFGESLVIERMLERASDDRERLSLLAEALHASISTVFNQVAWNRFEERGHTLRRTEGELTVDQLDRILEDELRKLHGDETEHVAGFERFWSVIPHFFLWPGYVYAYAYGQLLSLSIYARYKETGPAFVPRYLEMLGAGGSRSPEDLGKIVGIDLSDPGFWASGLELVDAQLRSVEELAAKIQNQ
jgi:oligoendopeptidase F